MRFDKHDLNLFVVFDGIYRERSLTRVASQLNITQPAVSNALGRLRDSLNDPLFVRSAQGMAPTPVAHSIAGDVRQALNLFRRSMAAGASFEPASSDRVFHVGMNDLAEALLLPSLYAAVKAQAPSVVLTSYYVARESATEDLRSDVIDLLLDAPAVNAKHLHQQPLSEYPYVLAVREGHPLAGSAVSLEDYLEGEHLHVSSRRKGRGHVDIALHRLGRQRRVVMRVQNYLVAARIAQETDLFWSVPRVLAESLPLHIIDLPFTVESLAWTLYWSMSAENDPANAWLRKKIIEIAADVTRES